MNPVIVDRSQHPISRRNISPEALKVLYRLKNAGFLAYLAGGSVRDLLLGRIPKDFDVVTDAHPNQVKRLFRNCRLVGRRFRLAHVFFPHAIIEVSTFRAHVATAAGATGRQHVKSAEGLVVRDNVFGTPPEDANRRDFTINALFYNIADFSIVDYVGGLRDLDARILRVIGDPRTRFQEDPVRMIRAVRFAASLGFTIEASAWRALLDMKDLVRLASRERLYEEMLKIAFCGRAAAVAEALLQTGLFTVLFPDAGAWLETSEGAAERSWMLRAFGQADRWKAAGLTPREGLLWTLVFGAYHERLAAGLQNRGLPRPAALARAVHTHLLNPDLRVQIPRKVAREAADILAAQPFFERTRGRFPQQFAARRVFREAFVYLKFAVHARGNDEQLIQWWNRFLGPGRRPPEARDIPTRTGPPSPVTAPRPPGTPPVPAEASSGGSPKSDDSTG